MLLNHFKTIPRDLDGLTVSGGEPFQQVRGLNGFLQRIKEEFPQWNIMVYTGYTLEELRVRDKLSPGILEQIDILVEGRFLALRPSHHPFLGSENQQIHCLTSQGKTALEAGEGQELPAAEFGIGKEDLRILVGTTEPEMRKTVHSALGVSRDQED